VADLRRLRLMAGSPSLNRLVALTAGLQRPLRRSTISDKLNGKSLPEWDFVVSFTTACRMHAEQAGRPLPDDAVDLAGWDDAHWRMLRVVDRAHADERLAAAAKAEIGRRAGATPQRRAHIGLIDAQSQRTVPHQLPAAVRHFAGRAAELGSLNALVDEAAGSHDTVEILAIEGNAGIGKTSHGQRCSVDMGQFQVLGSDQRLPASPYTAPNSDRPHRNGDRRRSPNDAGPRRHAPSLGKIPQEDHFQPRSEA